MQRLEWSDIHEISILLSDEYPDIDPQWISFPDLHSKVCNLTGFVGDPKKSNEKILEAIQMLWIEEFE
jgi:FeS assembly protein IscX